MEESALETKKKCSIPISEINILNNKNEDNEQNISFLEELNNIINDINKDFDFKNFEKEKLYIIEKVIKYIIIILLCLVFYSIKFIDIRRGRIIIRFI